MGVASCLPAFAACQRTAALLPACGPAWLACVSHLAKVVCSNEALLFSAGGSSGHHGSHGHGHGQHTGEPSSVSSSALATVSFLALSKALLAGLSVEARPRENAHTRHLPPGTMSGQQQVDPEQYLDGQETGHGAEMAGSHDAHGKEYAPGSMMRDRATWQDLVASRPASPGRPAWDALWSAWAPQSLPARCSTNPCAVWMFS